MKKRMMTVALAVLMLLSFAGCQLSVEDQLIRSLLKWQQIETMDTEVECYMEIEIMDEKIALNMDMDIAFDSGQQKSMTEVTLAIPQMTQSMKAYSEQLKDGKIVSFTDAGNGWAEQEITEQHEGLVPDSNIKKNIGLYLENIKSFEDAGMEELNGKKARKITGTLAEDNLKSMLELSMGPLEDMIGDITGDQLFEGLQSVPMVLWIDPQSHYIIKLDLDIKDTVSTLMQNMLQDVIGMGVQIDFGVCYTTMTVNTINSDAFDFNRIQKPNVD
ncbi:MAG: hypothetical protein ACOYJC_09100 [Christensenellales bacterium]